VLADRFQPGRAVRRFVDRLHAEMTQQHALELLGERVVLDEDDAERLHKLDGIG
jgi:hypothetical protein